MAIKEQRESAPLVASSVSPSSLRFNGCNNRALNEFVVQLVHPVLFWPRREVSPLNPLCVGPLDSSVWVARRASISVWIFHFLIIRG
jgi:hypothetical protein